jgi:hypothetical protein
MTMSHDTLGNENLRNDMATKTPSSQIPECAYVIERSIPVPVKRYFKDSKYPFGRMKPGESILITDKKYSTIVGTLRRYKMMGMKFTVRSVDGGFRVWKEK